MCFAWYYRIISAKDAEIIRTEPFVAGSFLSLFAWQVNVWYDGNNFCNSLAQKEWDFPLFSVVQYRFLKRVYNTHFTNFGRDKMSKITEEVEKLVSPIVEDLKLELVDIEFVKEGRDWFLRVYIDTPEGNIDIDQCAQVSEKLSEELDRTDPIPAKLFS